MSVDLLCILLTLFACICMGTSVLAAEYVPPILPAPKKIIGLEGRVQITGSTKKPRACFLSSAQSPAIRTGINQVNEKILDLGGTTLPLLNKPEDAANSDVLIWAGTFAQLPELAELLGGQQAVPAEAHTPDGYVLRCVKVRKQEVAVCLGHNERGCYYALQTLIQLLSEDNTSISLPRVEITDWPTYRIRLVKTSGSKDDPAIIERLAHLLPRYKINVYALQYHNEPDGTWRQPSKQ